jgi:hypothetical protein
MNGGRISRVLDRQGFKEKTNKDGQQVEETYYRM